MKCEQCGKELKQGAKFCSSCGNKVTPRIEVEKSDKGQKTLVIILGILLLCILGGIIGVLFGLKKNGMDFWKNSSYQNAEEGEEEESLAIEESYDLLVCVPVESMSLRETPGFGEDIIVELKPGTYLKWYGESVVVNETEFYKVTLKDSGEEGYLSARYCVDVDFDYECVEQKLDIVETKTALYTYEMMLEDIDTLCNQYPDRLQDNMIAYSADGREIHEIILGNPAAENHIMMQAGIHGREYMTSQLVMKMLEYYACFYEEGSFDGVSYQDIFDKTAIHVVTMSNPDGVTISQLGVEALNNSYFADIIYECYERDKGTLAYEEDSNGDMNWNDYYKKAGYNREASGHFREITFEEYQRIWKANARGVDLNNNFDADWAAIDLKKAPSYGSFKGDYPLSESESQALVEMAYKHDYKCFLSYHARGQLIYYDVVGNSLENSQASLDLANALDDWIKYGPVNTAGAYNVNLGGFGDWVQLSLNKPSVTIENGKRPCPLEADEFTAIWYRHRESWAMLGKQYFK